MKKFVLRFTGGTVAALLLPQVTFAYVGPGAGLTAIGTVLAVIGAILLGIFGFIWYPIKRFLRRNKPVEDVEGGDAREQPDSVPEKKEAASVDP